MIIQLIFLEKERTKAENIIKALFRIVPHTDAKYCKNGNLHMHTIQTDSAKGGG